MAALVQMSFLHPISSSYVLQPQPAEWTARRKVMAQENVLAGPVSVGQIRSNNIFSKCYFKDKVGQINLFGSYHCLDSPERRIKKKLGKQYIY